MLLTNQYLCQFTWALRVFLHFHHIEDDIELTDCHHHSLMDDKVLTKIDNFEQFSMLSLSFVIINNFYVEN